MILFNTVSQTPYYITLAVSAIKKKHLAEVRSMANPPAVVKLALESVCELLSETATDWKAIRGILVKDSFIPSIVNLKTENITYGNTHYFLLI